MMTFYDLLIIYLACGAPLGVYYFLQNRRENAAPLYFKTFINFLFWMPFAFQILLENKALGKLFSIIFVRRADTDSDIEKKLARLRKNLETAIINQIPQTTENIPPLSVFEVREVLERYTGLTLAVKAENLKPRFENEFYKISVHKKPRLATICFSRRNRQRLFFHHKRARLDFLTLIGTPKDKNFRQQVVEFVIFLKDFEAQSALEKIFASDKQTEKPQSVQQTEKELWKSGIRKPQPIGLTTSARLKISQATMNLRAKD